MTHYEVEWHYIVRVTVEADDDVSAVWEASDRVDELVDHVMNREGVTLEPWAEDGNGYIVNRWEEEE